MFKEIKMLYSLNQIQAKIAAQPLYKEKKVDIIKFFLLENLVVNEGFYKIYTSDKYPSFFLDEKSIDALFAKAQEKFQVPFNKDIFYDGARALLKINDEEGVSHVAKTKDDIERIEVNHLENSSYGKQKSSQDEQKQIQKDKKMAILQAQIDAKKEEERAQFDRATNLNRDFMNNKVVSIDFEFFINKDDSYTPTELGISISENGKIESYHFLIKEHYEKKRNKTLQGKFDFGQTQIVSESQIGMLLEYAIKDSKYILFHEQREDSQIFQQVNVAIPNTVDVLDTQLCYKRYFRKKGSLPNGEKLESLLSMFKIEYKHLHNAGNDSYYTLVLLQKMAQTYKNKNESSKKMRP